MLAGREATQWAGTTRCLCEIKVPRHLDSRWDLVKPSTLNQSSPTHFFGVSSLLRIPHVSMSESRLIPLRVGNVVVNLEVVDSIDMGRISFPKSISLTSQQTLCEFRWIPRKLDLISFDWHWDSLTNFNTALTFSQKLWDFWVRKVIIID